MGRPFRRPSHDGLSTAPDNAKCRPSSPAHGAAEPNTGSSAGRSPSPVQRTESKMAPQPIEKARFGVGFGKPESFSRP